MVKVKIHPKMNIIPYVVLNLYDFLFPWNTKEDILMNVEERMNVIQV